MMGFNFVIIPRVGGTRINYDPEASNKYYFYFRNPASLAQSYRLKLSVTPIEEDASLVTLSTTGYIPGQEADYLNKLMDVYCRYGLEIKNETAVQTLEFIEKQLSSVSDSLGRAERRLENFRLQNKLIDISREGQIIQNKLEQTDAEKSKLLLQRNYYVYLKEYIDLKKESGDIVAPSVMGISDQFLIKLVEDLARFQQSKQQLSLNLYETSEPLKILEYNINSTRKAISENVVSGLDNIDKALLDIDTRLADIEKDIRRLPSTEKEMINIQRGFEINNTVYTFLLEKSAEAGIAKASNVADNTIIDHAGNYSTSMIKPRARKNYITALLLGLFFPMLGIFLVDYLNNKIIDKKDVEKGTRAPILGYISHNDLTNEIPVIERPSSSMAESFRSVRTNLKYFLKGKENSVIAISSTITAEGKTFVSTNLAAIIASMEKKVLLVGLDLRKPRTHKILGIDNSTGISKYLIGEEKFEDILIKTNVTNLWYAPSGPVPPNPAELIDSEKMKEFIEKAKARFDYIIIDTPPVAIVTDALLLSSLANVYIFVVRQRYSSKNTLDLIEELYRNENVKNICIVLNDISLTGSYGYGLRYGYSASYAYSYGYNYYGDYVNRKYGYTDEERGYYNDKG